MAIIFFLKKQCLEVGILSLLFILTCVILPNVADPGRRSVTRYFVNKSHENAILFWYIEKNVNNSSKAWSKAHKIVILKSTFQSSAMIYWTRYQNIFSQIHNATENCQIGLRFNNSWRSTFCKWNFFPKLLALCKIDICKKCSAMNYWINKDYDNFLWSYLSKNI